MEKNKGKIAVLLLLAAVVGVAAIGYQIRYILIPQRDAVRIAGQIYEAYQTENEAWDNFMEACKTNRKNKILKAADEALDAIERSTAILKDIEVPADVDKEDRQNIEIAVSLLLDEYMYRTEAFEHVGKFYETRKDQEINEYDKAKQQAERIEKKVNQVIDSLPVVAK